MILLNSALCSKDFRKVGIIHAGVFIFFQTIILFFLSIFCFVDKGAGYQWVYFGDNFRIAACFVIIEIVIYSILIYGLSMRKPTILLLWLTFASLEFIIVLMALLFIVYAITYAAGIGGGAVALIAFVLITSFMFHNTCIVYSARHGFILSQGLRNLNVAYQPINATAIITNVPAPAYHQCNLQHFEYNEKLGQYTPCICAYPQFPPNYQGVD